MPTVSLRRGVWERDNFQSVRLFKLKQSMNNKNKLEKNNVFLVFLIVGLLWLITPYVLIKIIPTLEQRALWGDAFGILNTLYSGLALAGLIYTIILQRQQLKLQQEELSATLVELKKQRSATVFIEVLHILEELRPYWHKSYTFPEDFKRWNKNQLKIADKLSTDLQRISYLCSKDLIDADYVMGNHSKTFVRVWHKLEKYIRDYRIKSNEPPSIEAGAYQRRHFEQFAKQCEEYLIRYNYNSK